MTPFPQNPLSLVGRLSWCILSFQNVEVLQEKSLLLTGGVAVTGAMLAPTPLLTRGHSEGLLLLLIIVMSGGTDFADLYLMGLGS